MKGKLIDFAIGLDGKQRVTFAPSEDFRRQWDELHDEEQRVRHHQHTG